MTERVFTVSDPRIDSEQLVARAREVARRGGNGQRPHAPGLELMAQEAGDARAPWMGVVDLSIGNAERHWEVGMRVPPMKKIQGVLRAPAEALARGTLRISQLVTRQQRDFNQATVGAMRSLRNALLQQGAVLRTQVLSEVGGRMEALASTLEGASEALRTQVAALEQRVTALERKPAEPQLEALRQQLHQQQQRLEALERELRSRPSA